MSKFDRRNFLKISGITALGSSLLPFGNLGCGNRKSVPGETLYEIFKSPPSEYRPFVRWWWNGNRLEKQEIERQLDLLNEAGIGGVEINPIAMPSDIAENPEESLTWLSDEWNEMVAFATTEASNRGMTSDMIVGAGWPFGGEFLSPEEQMKGVVLQKIELEGPQTYRENLDNIIEIRNRPDESDDGNQQHGPEPELLFLRLAPEQIGSVTECEDVTNEVGPDGSMALEVPEGRHVLYLGTIQKGITFREITLGAPGSDGPCLDHYNNSAVLTYLNRVSDRLGPSLGGELGMQLRALFVDSIELSGSNWTQDLPEQFRKRRGYELEPYYPFVFYENPYGGYSDPISFSHDLQDTVKRARYDYNHTLVELFLERFVQTFHEWCESKDLLSRYQAYGLPWLMGMAEGYTIPDIPEANNWLFNRPPYVQGYNIWTKYASAGAHLTGKSTVSTEAMTNTR
ncbi:MAG: glycosyl hydrolase, partial [Balneolaceae bacterium]|nr:glycosyl hydrolase [Balneolaceae bacterium]